MKLSLPANINKLRKEHSMTQEQLAEALGVTFASVSKWERGVATPELNLIAEMADLFGVSLDALVGFAIQNSGADAIAERLHTLEREKQYDEAIIEAEKALVRFPNDFRIVYRSGGIYGFAGMERNNKQYISRCIELLKRSIALLPQNADSDISEGSIQYEIAQCYIILGEKEKGIELLKKNNVCGVHDALIALTYCSDDDIDSMKAEPYLNGAFSNIINAIIRVMLAYGNYYFKTKDYEKSRDDMLWLTETLNSIKADKNAVAYVDKMIASCYSECAHLSLMLGETDKVEPYLYRAYRTAKNFDAAPTYKMGNMKFLTGAVKNATAYDDLGESAIASVEKQITQENRNEQLISIWKKIVQEKSHGGIE